MPSIFEDLPESHQARSGYVAHLISTCLVQRVFRPFLFGLGCRFEDTEELLTDVGEQIRAKSALREAAWRQQTLLAAYTTKDAKLRMNQEAGKVMDEILKAILPLCTEGSARKDELRTKVRKIVKLAVETWRYARLERERIEASMPMHGDIVSKQDLGKCWLPYSHQDVNGIEPGMGSEHGLLLRVFPKIERERVQEIFCASGKDENDQGCTYSKGFALYTAH